jgi:hypothetical protein
MESERVLLISFAILIPSFKSWYILLGAGGSHLLSQLLEIGRIMVQDQRGK